MARTIIGFYKAFVLCFFVLLLLLGPPAAAQQGQKAKPNWQNLNLKTDGVFGVSTEKAYNELLKGKKSEPVIVAVIDDGIDTSHTDIKNGLWINRKEIPYNGIDDDKNGYIDDIHGWNFLGSSKGDIVYDNDYMIVKIRKLQKHFGDKDSTDIPKRERTAFREYLSMKKEIAGIREPLEKELNPLLEKKALIVSMLDKIGKPVPSLEEFKQYKPANEEQYKAQLDIIWFLKTNPDFNAYMLQKIIDPIEYIQIQTDYYYNLAYEPRAGNEEFAECRGRYYGNNHIQSQYPFHGTHLAGIIAGERDNNIGVKGVADNAKIMTIRVMPYGAGRDKDIANAVWYAVENGAKVINMSFCSDEPTTETPLVDQAIKHAMQKDVLIVHAAGNRGKNTDEHPVFPNCRYTDGLGVAKNWIEVGASDMINNEKLIPYFTDFGKKTVDVFAPGVQINSTLPENEYGEQSGTSMAAPVVAGLAALIRSYYPKLSASQVKEIIIKSVVKTDFLKDKCISGGVVNAYEALKLADSYK